MKVEQRSSADAKRPSLLLEDDGAIAPPRITSGEEACADLPRKGKSRLGDLELLLLVQLLLIN